MHHNDAGADQEQLHHVYQQLDLILFVVVVRGLHYSELVGNHHPQSSGMQPILQRPRLRVPTEAARQTVAKLPRARGLRQELRDDCIDVHDKGDTQTKSERKSKSDSDLKSKSESGLRFLQKNT